MRVFSTKTIFFNEKKKKISGEMFTLTPGFTYMNVSRCKQFKTFSWMALKSDLVRIFATVFDLITAHTPIRLGVVGWCEGAVYLISLGRPTDIGLQLGKACYPCSG